MNQQLLKGVNSIESLQETGGYSPTQVAKSRYSSLVVSKKYRVLFLIAGVLVILVVCAAVFAAVGVSQSLSAHSENVEKRITDDQLIELATKEQLLKQVILLWTYALCSGSGTSKKSHTNPQSSTLHAYCLFLCKYWNSCRPLPTYICGCSELCTISNHSNFCFVCIFRQLISGLKDGAGIIVKVSVSCMQFWSDALVIIVAYFLITWQ